jgi:hypothetical protein
MAPNRTRFGSLAHFEKGGVEVIKDDARNYVFSNLFEVASKARPYEKVAVGKNIEYVIEAIRAEGTSGWRVACQDEFALVMDGEVEVRLLKPDDGSLVPAGGKGSIPLPGSPPGRKMGYVKARRGHMTLLPAGAAYQFHAGSPSVILLQTLAGRDTVERWAEICQTAPRPEAKSKPTSKEVTR